MKTRIIEFIEDALITITLMPIYVLLLPYITYQDYKRRKEEL